MARRVIDFATQLAREKWRSSGIPDNVAEQLGLRYLSPEQTSGLGGHFVKTDALYIPYFTTTGAGTGFFRVRYLGPLPGFAGAVKKPRKYDQPADTLNEVYCPPILPRSWEAICADATTPIYITEGELKAAAGCIHGFATLGLGGVDVWRAGKRGVDLLPALAGVVWGSRTVYIVYDSDAAENAHVVGAQIRLAKELVGRGARAHIVSLSSGPDGAKAGLDDFLAAKGREAFEELVEQAIFFPEAAALWEMNADVVYIRDPGLVVVRSSGQRLSPGNFVQHAFANRHYKEAKPTQKGTSWVEKKTAPRWIEWEQRYELMRMTYAPGQPQVTAASEWNTWKGWGVAPKKGSILPWNWLLNYIFKEDNEARHWFEQWLAYPLQHPGTKLFTSAVLWSVHQGTGKTLLGRTLMRIYGKNSVEIQDADLRKPFNSWAVDRQFVLGEEVVGDNKRGIADKFKSMITQEEIHIEEKYLPAYVVPDCINYLFTSNHPDAFFLEDTDRRFFIHEIVGPPEERQQYEIYDAWYRSYGASALFEHLLQLNLSGFNPRNPAPMTTAKRLMIEDNKSDLAAWVEFLRDDTTSALAPLGERAATKAELLTNKQLLRAYDPAGSGRVTATGLGRELKRHLFRQLNEGLPIRTKLGLQKLYVVRNITRWEKAGLPEAAQHFEEVFGQEKY